MIRSTNFITATLLIHTMLLALPFETLQAGGKLRRQSNANRTYYTQTTSDYRTAPGFDTVAPSPMLGSFVPNNTMWVRGNGMMGGGYTPLNQDERDSLSLYGPFSASRSQMRSVRVLQPTGYDGLVPVSAGDAAAYPNFPWSDSLPRLSESNRVFRPRSSGILPGWTTDSDTIDQQ